MRHPDLWGFCEKCDETNDLYHDPHTNTFLCERCHPDFEHEAEETDDVEAT
jgi:hypothetical protein